MLVGRRVKRRLCKNIAILLCLRTWSEIFGCSFTVTTSWWRCPLVVKSGVRKYCSRNAIDLFRRSSIRMATH